MLRWNRKIISLFLILVVTCVLGGELFAKYFLGLGTPALLIEDPAIEYMFKPDQDVYRFGKHIVINHYGMRSAPFLETDKHDMRVLVFGDSVVNGGNLLDQDALATTILQAELAKRPGDKKVYVGNVSANSWGPANWLAYAKKFGFFDASVIVLVVSSHDYADNPTFKPIDPASHPSSPPASALLEGISKYWNKSKVASESDKFEQPSEIEIERGIGSLKEFLTLAQRSAKTVLVLQHWERDEITSKNAKPGNLAIRSACESLGLSSIQLQSFFQQSLDDGKSPYRDNIHVNQLGQQLIANAILENIPEVNSQSLNR